ncbi:hypothetical protein N7475_005744 [Penicillium sp. IBT 31633x]|nr:hypothetical protein N7475_005744 [Penicillium sp. IBT 31633x]
MPQAAHRKSAGFRLESGARQLLPTTNHNILISFDAPARCEKDSKPVNASSHLLAKTGQHKRNRGHYLELSAFVVKLTGAENIGLKPLYRKYSLPIPPSPTHAAHGLLIGGDVPQQPLSHP